MQDAIAAQVSAALLPELTGQRALAHYTEDAEAYQLYVNGRFHRLRSNEAGVRRGLAYFEQAIERDPGFALAYVGIADCYSILGAFGIEAPEDAFPPARGSRQAIALAPDLGDAYASLGHIKMQFDQDSSGAEAALRRSVELNPAYASSHQWLGLYLGYTGHLDEAIAAARRASSLDPSPVFSAFVGMLLNYQRRYDEAVDQLENTLEMDPDFATRTRI